MGTDADGVEVLLGGAAPAKVKRVRWSSETMSDSNNATTSTSSKASASPHGLLKNTVVKGIVKKDNNNNNNNKTATKNWLSAFTTDGKKNSGATKGKGGKSTTTTTTTATASAKTAETENIPPTEDATAPSPQRRVSPSAVQTSISATNPTNDPMCSIVLSRAPEEPLGVLLHDLKVAALNRNAQSCGLNKGDTIIRINGQGVETSEEAMAIMLGTKGPIDITLIRSGFEFAIEDV